MEQFAIAARPLDIYPCDECAKEIAERLLAHPAMTYTGATETFASIAHRAALAPAGNRFCAHGLFSGGHISVS